MGPSWTRARTRVPCIGRRILNHCATRAVPGLLLINIWRLSRVSWGYWGSTCAVVGCCPSLLPMFLPCSLWPLTSNTRNVSNPSYLHWQMKCFTWGGGEVMPSLSISWITKRIYGHRCYDYAPVFQVWQLIKYQDPVRSNHLRSTGHSTPAALLTHVEDSTQLLIYLAQTEFRSDESSPFLNEFYKCQKVEGFCGVPFQIHLVPCLK